MKRFAYVVSAAAASLVGCAGIEITPITKESAASLHSEESDASGYLVYEPVVVVEVSAKNICVEKDDKGNCKDHETVCSAGSPFVMPNYTKPYKVSIKSGFGKAGVEVNILDGWRLGNVKNSSDNTSVLGAIEKLTGLAALSRSRVPPTKCESPGLYRVAMRDDSVVLVPMLVYVSQ